MYYPYLRGKQFELLALREFVDLYSNNCNIFPVIEPVKTSFNSMKIALNKFIKENIFFAVVLNPQIGDLVRRTNLILEELQNELSDRDRWMPTFIVNNKPTFIQRLITNGDFQRVMLICSESVNIDDPEFIDLIKLPSVSKVLISGDNRSLKRKLDSLGKEIIRFDDQFKAQKKNADYIDVLEERFTEEHCYYLKDGFQGFSDYTVLSSDYSDGGRLPYAVAIHLTYQKNADEIWVRHFVSDTNDDNTNIQKKFGEAAKKAVEFFGEIGYSNEAINELAKYFEHAQYPGLGVLKKISIKSHIELINGILQH